MSELWIIKKRGLFYRPDARGYTKYISEAGLFSEKQARAHYGASAGVSIHRLVGQLPQIDAERKLIEAEHAKRLGALDIVERAALGLR